jgi:hypothetical protein
MIAEGLVRRRSAARDPQSSARRVTRVRDSVAGRDFANRPRNSQVLGRPPSLQSICGPPVASAVRAELPPSGAKSALARGTRKFARE